MRRIAFTFALAAALFAVVAEAATLPRKAPEFVIQNPGGRQDLLSSYRGKAVVFAFMFTTCQHCQHTAGVLAQVQKEYGPKGAQVLGAIFNPEAQFQVQQFNKMFGVNFPCGYTNPKAVNDFIQQPPNEPPFVPILVFIDRKGMIRSQYVGDENFLRDQEKNIRAELDKLLRK